ncbi:unnamed protein product [Closterium sp. NIES-53]
MDSAKTAPAVISNGNPSADHHPAAPAASTSSSAGKPARLFRQPSRVTERMANCLLENRNEIVDTLSRCLQCGNGILLPHQLIDQLRAASAARRRPHATPPRTAASPRSPTAIVTAGGAAGALIPADAEIAKVLEGTVEAVRRVGSADLEAWRRAEGRRKSGAGAGEAEATGAASADRVDRVDGDEEGEGEESLEDSPFGKLLLASQEAVVVSPWVALAVRVRPGEWQHVKINAEEVLVQAMTVPEYLAFKELLVSSNGGPTSDNPYYVLELDFGPFNASFPRLTQPRSIGHGVHFLNRYLSSRIFTSQQGSIKPLVDFLRLHSYRGQPLMLSQQIETRDQLKRALTRAEDLLGSYDDETPVGHVAERLRDLGLELGWGNTVGRISETVNLLLDIFQAPDADTLEKFLGRLPMIFDVVILSPHGYFGQANVLGLPDTGGQVVYILDQVRAVEKEMLRSLHLQGLDSLFHPNIVIVTRLIPEARGTTCNQRIEAVAGTQFTRILRVPFRTARGIVTHWVSRFDIWPYLEQFTEDVAKELQVELGGRPGLIIGNYSDGNLVATLLSHQMGVTQVRTVYRWWHTVAHGCCSRTFTGGWRAAGLGGDARGWRRVMGLS